MGLVDLSDLPILGGDDLLPKYAIPGVMMRPVREMLTGILTLADGSRVRTVGYISGQPMFATSNLVSERLGGRLVAQNLLTPEQQTEIDALMRQEGIRFGEAALQLKLLSKSELLPHIKAQQMAVIAKVLGADSMQASFVGCDVPQDLSYPSLLAAIEDGVREYKTLEIIDLLKEIESLIFAASNDDIELASKLGCSETLTRLLAALLDRPRPLNELLGADNDVPPAPAALTIVLCQLGHIVTAEAAAQRTLAEKSERSEESSGLDSVASIVSALSEAAEHEPPATEEPAPNESPSNESPSNEMQSNERVDAPFSVSDDIPKGPASAGSLSSTIANDIAQDMGPDPTSPAAPVEGIVDAPSATPLRTPRTISPRPIPPAPAVEKATTARPPWVGFVAGIVVGAVVYALGEHVLTKSDPSQPASKPVVGAVTATPASAPASIAAAVETTSPEDRAGELYKAGNDALKQKKFDEAIVAYKQALALDATMAVAHRALGIAYTSKEDETAAVKEYKAYLKLAPDAKDRAQVKALIEAMSE